MFHTYQLILIHYMLLYNIAYIFLVSKLYLIDHVKNFNDENLNARTKIKNLKLYELDYKF